jgi:putative oxidoreductase
MQALVLLGRVLMSALFLIGGYEKLMAPSATMATFNRLHLPVVGAVYALAVAVELGGGLMLLAGYKTRYVAVALAAWCIATALVAHLHPADRMQMINFWKNCAIAGGFLQLAAFGPGRFSVDRR